MKVYTILKEMLLGAVSRRCIEDLASLISAHAIHPFSSLSYEFSLRLGNLNLYSLVQGLAFSRNLDYSLRLFLHHRGVRGEKRCASMLSPINHGDA